LRERKKKARVPITEIFDSKDRPRASVNEAAAPTEPGPKAPDLDEIPEKPKPPRGRKLFRFFKWAVALLVLAACLFIFRDRIFVTVETGEVLVVYYRLFGGTEHNRIGSEGLHLITPWDKAYRYVVQSQTLVEQLTVISKNGLEVHLDAQIRFHPIPDMVPHLHRRFGPDYVETFVKPQLQSSVQRVIGQFQAEEVYGSESGASASRIFENTRQVVGGEFLEIEDVAIFNIKLPEAVQTAIQNKVEAEQNALAHAFKVEQEKQESQRKLEEAKGLQEYTKLVAGIPHSVLLWKGIEATQDLAKSPNAKIVVIGAKGDLPLILGNVPDVK
jgi:prohibitin 1